MVGTTAGEEEKSEAAHLMRHQDHEGLWTLEDEEGCSKDDSLSGQLK